jgi:hypothetical protein
MFTTPALLAGCNEPGFNDCLLHSAGFENGQYDIPDETDEDSSQIAGADPLNAALSRFHTTDKSGAAVADRGRKGLVTPQHQNRSCGVNQSLRGGAMNMAGVGNTGTGFIGADDNGRRHGLNNLFSLDVLMMAQKSAGAGPSGGGGAGGGSVALKRKVDSSAKHRATYNPAVDSHCTNGSGSGSGVTGREAPTRPAARVNVRHRPQDSAASSEDYAEGTNVKLRR